jgi:hypothetical protein
MAFTQFPKYYAIFSDFENIVQTKYPNEYASFQKYSGDLILKIRCLEIICLRYNEDKKNHVQIMDRLERFIENIESFPQKELQDENETLANLMIKHMSQLIVDVESFYIYARIMFDRLPPLLKPFLKGIVSNNEVATISFYEFLKWFKNNSSEILDDSFRREILSFRKWFLEKIRAPRNEFIVHSKWDIVQQAILPDGTLQMTRLSKSKNRAWLEIESIELPDIQNLMERIITFLEFINIFFSSNLSK